MCLESLGAFVLLVLGVVLFLLPDTNAGVTALGFSFICIGIILLAYVYDIDKKRSEEKVRRARHKRIYAHVNKWGAETCAKLERNELELGMTEKMVVAALGKPDIVDQISISARGERRRYVYGEKGKNAIYVWLKNDTVSKLETT